MAEQVAFKAKDIAANQARMESERSGFDSLRGEIADLVLPQSAGFNQSWISQGRSQTNAQYDEYAAIALQDGVSAFEGFVMPRGQKWQGMRTLRAALMDNVTVAQWFEEKQDLVFAMRNDPRSGFTNAVHASGESLFAFGEQSTWIDKRYDDFGRFAGLSYQSEHIDGIWCDLDSEGNVMRVHRRFTLTAEQAQAKWQERAPLMVREAMNPLKNQASERFTFIHVIERNAHRVPGRMDHAGMPWRACYYSERDKDADRVFLTGGYRTLRRVVSHFSRSPGESYGRGPGGLVLPAIRASQVMMQDRVLATEMSVKPPLLAADDDLDQAIIALGPWGITYGGLDDMGREALKPLFGNSIELSGAQQLHAEVHEVIDRVFYRYLMQINREQKTHISATKTMEEIGEKGILLAPLARQEQTWFSPMLDVELDLLWEEGFLDDMPDVLQQEFGAGGGISVVYDNNLSRMQEANEAAGYLRTAEQVASVAQFDPSAVKHFTREYPLAKVIPGLGRVNGIPARWRASAEEKQAEEQAEAVQQQMQQLLEAAPVIADAAKNAAQAGAISGG
jgi:hypothetical protein